MERRRALPRNSHMYIDVLHIQDISDAVRHASTMLREGILHAMSSNVQAAPTVNPTNSSNTAHWNVSSASSISSQTPRTSSATGPTDTENTIKNIPSNINSKNDSNKFNESLSVSTADPTSTVPSPASSSRDRDPLSVYSAAVAKRPRKHSSTSTPLVDGPALRDSLSVYTAVTKSVRRPPPPEDISISTSQQNSDSLTLNDKTTDHQVNISNSKLQSDEAGSSVTAAASQPFPSSQQQALRAWNRDKKAGPSILSKRAHHDASVSVFQPVSKRGRRDDPRTRKPTSASTTTNVSATANLPVTTGGQLSNTQPTNQLQSTVEGNVATTLVIAKEVNTETPVDSGKQQENVTIPPVMIPAKKIVTASHRESKEKERERQKHLQLQKHQMLENQKQRSNAMDIADDNENIIETPEGAAAAMAAVSSSKFRGKHSMKGTTLSAASALLGGSHQPSPTLSFLRKKIGAGSSISPSAATNLTMTRATIDGTATAKLQITTAQKEAFMRRGGMASVSALRNGPNGSSANSMSTTAKPSNAATIGTAGGKQIQYVPGCTAIDGVQPNGYIVSELGVVKPMITFTPNPKVPHKLRQNVLEKIFAAWKDERKIEEANALQKSLQAEHEIYAQTVGRVEYRTSMLARLKEIRAGRHD